MSISTSTSQSAASAQVPSPPADQEWSAHEHVGDTAKLQAQKLVDELGSVDLAKQALDAVGEAVKSLPNDGQQSGLATSLGFQSYEQLLQASRQIPSNDGHHWLITPLANEAWAVWNEEQLRVDRQFSDREEALASVPHVDEFTGSSLLG